MAKDPKGLAIAILARKKPAEEAETDMADEGDGEEMDEGLVSAATDVQDTMGGDPAEFAKALKTFMEMV